MENRMIKRNNLLLGFFRVLDFGATNKSKFNRIDRSVSDESALAQDWERVGESISKATKVYGVRVNG